MLKVSVVINNFNYAEFVGAAVESALMQDYPDVEVVVVDDGSSDGSRAVLDTYRDRIRILYKANQGQAEAINVGVSVSTGDIICFLDSDDCFEPEKVSRVVDAYNRESHASLIYHRLQPVRSDGTRCLKAIPRTLCSGDLAPRLKVSAGWWPFPLTSAIAVPRSMWDEVGPIPKQFRISADAWIAGVFPFFGPVVALPNALAFYRLHERNNWTRNEASPDSLRKRIAHWEAVVDATNQFLRSRGISANLCLNDHHPHHLASARLAGLAMADRLRLARGALGFPGEPRRLRRLLDAARIVAMPAIKETAAKNDR